MQLLRRVVSKCVRTNRYRIDAYTFVKETFFKEDFWGISSRVCGDGHWMLFTGSQDVSNHLCGDRNDVFDHCCGDETSCFKQDAGLTSTVLVVTKLVIEEEVRKSPALNFVTKQGLFQTLTKLFLGLSLTQPLWQDNIKRLDRLSFISCPEHDDHNSSASKVTSWNRPFCQKLKGKQ